ncbi:hypothetical protein QR680_013870 [Steinernema hermaphroditum]|uniref:L-dopachrome isomerase n=1 Tax=Steinernema hermaphroditum TaxID=289476 RepID=A0AA39M393_9BILA|nr:hypothetical protein QR680_013870 [Steinernema hermaphroditum]
MIQIKQKCDFSEKSYGHPPAGKPVSIGDIGYVPMPVVTVDTNVKEVDPSVAKTISENVAKCLKKPETYVMVQLNPGKNMCFSGTSDPCALMQIRSIGAISKESNNAGAAVLTKVLSEQLGVDSSRIFIEFFDVNGQNLALNGSTLR